MNEALAANIESLLADEKLYVIWQTGKQYFEEMKGRVAAHARLKLLQYVDRMDLTYAASDLAICRAGAITCSELMVTGTASVLVPSPNVAEDHQTHNAKSMAGAGAAVMVPESEMKERLMPVVKRLRNDPDQLREMEKAALKIARADAAENIALDVLSVAGFDNLNSAS